MCALCSYSPLTLLGRDELICVLDQLPPSQAERRPLLLVLLLHRRAAAMTQQLPPGVFQELYPHVSFELSCTCYERGIEHSELSVTYAPQTDTWNLMQWVVHRSGAVSDQVPGIVLDFDQSMSFDHQSMSVGFKDPQSGYVLRLCAITMASRSRAPLGYRIILEKDSVSTISDLRSRHPGYLVGVNHAFICMLRVTTAARRQRTAMQH